MSAAQKFEIKIPQKEIEAVMRKVRAFSWDDHPMPQIGEGMDRWIYGTDRDYLQELCRYWESGYDWRQTEASLNRFPHYRAKIDGQEIHFIHEKGSGHGRALLLTHGWPGSILEFMDVIPRLAHPERFGGDAQEGFDVIAPSLPGYGFSARPKKPIGPKGTAALWDTLMREVLNYESYIAQGGDWGAAVSAWLGYAHSRAKGGGCRAIHLNMYGLRAAGGLSPQTDEEKSWVEQAALMMDLEMGYFRMQATKPQTLSYGLMDSPVGICGWIVEKINSWSDTRPKNAEQQKRGAHIENAYSKDALLGNVMLYCLTKSFATSTWFYRGLFEEGGMELPSGEKVEVPSAIARYPHEFIPFPPRRMVEATYSHIVYEKSFEKGGHFAAWEAPEIFSEDVLSFASALKT